MEKVNVLTALEQRMLSFIGEYLRENAGRSPTLSEVGEHCGIGSIGTVHRYVKSLEEKGVLERARSGWRARLTAYQLPFCGTVAAGRPIEAVEHADGIDIPSAILQPDCFVLRVQGDSMVERGILDGDLVIVKSATAARSGQIVVAVIENEATLKEFRLEDAGQRVKLIPYNREHEVQVYDASQVEIRGILTAVVRTNP